MEKVFHMMLATSGAASNANSHLQQGLFWYNPWFENCANANCAPGLPHEAQIDSPHDNGALSAALYELDEVAGCADRQCIRDDSLRSGDNFALSGVDVGGRRLWRFTPNGTAVERAGPAELAVTLGQPIPGSNATALNCTLAFESGATLRPNASWAESFGVWVAQPAGAGAALRCPTVPRPIPWPIQP